MHCSFVDLACVLKKTEIIEAVSVVNGSFKSALIF